MNKTQIINEIKRIAAENGGTPPGHRLFASETGIGERGWKGRHWARWNDAIREAGLEPNERKTAFDETYLIEKLISLMRKVGHFPTAAELQLKRRSDPTFPTDTVYRRFGGKQQLVARVLNFAKDSAGFDDVIAFCEAIKVGSTSEKSIAKPAEAEVGFVYLIKSGRYYKIGRSNAAGRREREIALQLPEKAATVHTIRTDDPIGIEAYWHKRFHLKRKNGEWFELASEDIHAFKRRKFM